MVLVWQITDDSPNSPNFLPAKLSCYTVWYYISRNIEHYLPQASMTNDEIIKIHKEKSNDSCRTMWNYVDGYKIRFGNLGSMESMQLRVVHQFRLHTIKVLQNPKNNIL